MDNIAPPLDMDLGTIDTSMPLLADGLYDLQIVKVELKLTAAGTPMLSIQHKTTSPGRSVKGEDIGGGVTVFNNINLVPTGKATWEMVKRTMAELVKSSGGNVTYEQLTTGGKVLEGRSIRAKIKYSPAGVGKNGKSYKERNEIDYYLAPGQ